MSVVDEQISELKYYASYQECEKVKSIMYQAADTIECLFASLNKSEEECRYKYAEVYHIGETVDKLHKLCGEKIGWIHYGREISDSFRMIEKLCGVIESLSEKPKPFMRKEDADEEFMKNVDVCG